MCVVLLMEYMCLIGAVASCAEEQYMPRPQRFESTNIKPFGISKRLNLVQISFHSIAWRKYLLLFFYLRFTVRLYNLFAQLQQICTVSSIR